MWANRDWVGRHLPVGLRPGAELAAYARLCTAVEGNTTFYAVPPASTVARWAAEAPADFRFVCKLPRTITHDRRLRDASAELASFLDRIELLGDRLGPLSIQLPPSFGPDELDVLDAFLGSVPSGFRWSVEPRHLAFGARGAGERALDVLLRDHGADRVIIDTRALLSGPCETPGEREAFERKPRIAVRPTATASTPIVRFIGRTDLDANEPFLEPWVAAVARWLDAGLEPIVFLHTPDNRDAPVLARRFHAAVGAVADVGPPLPEPLPVEPQSRLF